MVRAGRLSVMSPVQIRRSNWREVLRPLGQEPRLYSTLAPRRATMTGAASRQYGATTPAARLVDHRLRQWVGGHARMRCAWSTPAKRFAVVISALGLGPACAAPLRSAAAHLFPACSLHGCLAELLESGKAAAPHGEIIARPRAFSECRSIAVLPRLDPRPLLLCRLGARAILEGWEVAGGSAAI